MRCKNPQYHKIKKKRLPWCEFYYTSRTTSRRDAEAPETIESQGISQRLGSCNVSSWSRLGQNFERLGLISVSAQKVSCTSLVLLC